MAYGLPPGAAASLTVNGKPVVGDGVVSADGNFYFPWTEDKGGTVTFVVTAGGVTRTFMGIF